MNYQKGSAHVVIIAILVVALIGALGYIFWQNFTQHEAVTKRTDVKTAKKTTPDKKTNPDEGLTVLTDWKARFKSGPEVYELAKHSNASAEYYTIGSEEVNKLCGGNDAYIGVISRYAPGTILGEQYDNMTAAEAFANAIDKVVTPNYIYILNGPQSACSENDTDMKRVIDKVAQLKTQFKTLEEY